MFYAHFVLAKKGPMARIWLAAHWDKKLTKAQIYETNIEKSVDGILQPKIKMALRTTGHLLLGIVRIYSRKTKYLLADCNEAFAKIKMAFRPGMVDLPDDVREAAVNAITLPEAFHNFDMASSTFDGLSLNAQMSLSQVIRSDDITLREDYGMIPMDFENGGFGEMPGMVDEEVESEMSILRESLLGGGDLQLANDDPISFRPDSFSRFSKSKSGKSRLLDMNQKSSVLRDSLSNGMGGLYESTSANFPSRRNQMSKSPQMDDYDNFDIPSPGAGDVSFGEIGPESPGEGLLPPPTMDESLQPIAGPSGMQSVRSVAGSVLSEHTTLLHDEDESFALAPVDASAIRGRNNKRKRKLIVDSVKAISGEALKAQMEETYDILIPLDLAPPTKKLMIMKEVGATDRLFSTPGQMIFSAVLSRHFDLSSLLPPTEAELEEQFGLAGDADRDNFLLDRMLGSGGGQRAGQNKKKRKDQPSLSERMQKIRRMLQISGNNDDQQQQQQQQQPQPSPAASSRMATPSRLAMTPAQLSVHTPGSGATKSPHYHPTPGNMIDDAGAASFRSASPGFEPDFGQDFGGVDENSDWMDLPAKRARSSGKVSFAPEVMDNSTACSALPVSHETSGQHADESLEAYEARVWNKRINQLSSAVKEALMASDGRESRSGKKLEFSKLIEKNSRKQAAQKFYSLLVLQKSQVVSVSQANESEEIFLSKGPRFEMSVC